MATDSPQQAEHSSSTALVDSAEAASSELWNEVLARLNQVQEGHRRVASALEHLGEVVSDTFEGPEVVEIRPSEAQRVQDLQGEPPLAHGPAVAEPEIEPEAEAVVGPEAEALVEPEAAVVEAQVVEARVVEARVVEARVVEAAVAEPEMDVAEPEAAVAEAAVVEVVEPPAGEPEVDFIEADAGPMIVAGSPFGSTTESVEAPAESRWLVEPIELEDPTAEEVERPWLALPAEQEVQAEAPGVTEDSVTVDELEPSDGSVSAVETGVGAETVEVLASPDPEPVVAVEQISEETEDQETGTSTLIEVAASAGIAPAEPGASLRILDTELTPELIDALLQSEFGEAAAKLNDPDSTLTVDALLGEEFAHTTVEVPSTGEASPERIPSQDTEDPLTAEAVPDDRALSSRFAPTSEANFDPTSQVLPAPPAPLPPPPKSAVSALQSLPYVQVSPQPASFDSPPLPARESAPLPPPPSIPIAPPPPPPPSLVVTSEALATEEVADAASEVPPLVFDSPLFGAESTLPVEPPPIPEPRATTVFAPESESDAAGDLLESHPAGETGMERGGDLPPLTFAGPLFGAPSAVTEEPSPMAEEDPIPAVSEPAGGLASFFSGGSDSESLSGDREPMLVEPEARQNPEDSFESESEPTPPGGLVTPFMSALSASEILSAAQDQAPPPHVEASDMEASPTTPGTPERNVVSQDFTIVSNKKRKHFRLR